MKMKGSAVPSPLISPKMVCFGQFFKNSHSLPMLDNFMMANGKYLRGETRVPE
jgi:hypothetical protein